MKRKKVIFLLVLGFLFIIAGIIYTIIISNPQKTKPQKEDKAILVDGSYTCWLKEKQFEGEDDSIITVTESYDFSYSGGEILYASITTNYKFLDLNSYHNFEWSDKNSSSSPNSIKESEENLEKQYKWLITIEKQNDTDNIQDYIKQLNNMGYTCKEK